uniref:Uncharacterized protein n=1 Tax=Ascaris lumbricoides TaxID=6252 RepID=A0A0M3INU6_ASCLU
MSDQCTKSGSDSRSSLHPSPDSISNRMVSSSWVGIISFP